MRLGFPLNVTSNEENQNRLSYRPLPRASQGGEGQKCLLKAFKLAKTDQKSRRSNSASAVPP